MAIFPHWLRLPLLNKVVLKRSRLSVRHQQCNITVCVALLCLKMTNCCDVTPVKKLLKEYYAHYHRCTWLIFFTEANTRICGLNISLIEMEIDIWDSYQLLLFLFFFYSKKEMLMLQLLINVHVLPTNSHLLNCTGS